MDPGYAVSHSYSGRVSCIQREDLRDFYNFITVRTLELGFVEAVLSCFLA